MITALRTAGKLLSDNFGRTPKITVKESDSSIVTETDIQSESIILEIQGIAEPYCIMSGQTDRRVNISGVHL